MQDGECPVVLVGRGENRSLCRLRVVGSTAAGGAAGGQAGLSTQRRCWACCCRAAAVLSNTHHIRKGLHSVGLLYKQLSRWQLPACSKGQWSRRSEQTERGRVAGHAWRRASKGASARATTQIAPATAPAGYHSRRTCAWTLPAAAAAGGRARRPAAAACLALEWANQATAACSFTARLVD